MHAQISEEPGLFTGLQIVSYIFHMSLDEITFIIIVIIIINSV